MIPFDLEYYRPDTIKEAIDIFWQLDSEGKSPVYYGGGTELISMARVGSRTFGAVIDIKNIPACRALGFEGENLCLGSALTLSDITESNDFPLLTKAAGRIADHTTQCKITLGGNLASTIIYRESVLPLLLTDATLTVAGETGLTETKIGAVFRERLLLEKGSFIVKAMMNRRFLKAPYVHVKKTKNEKIDYPLLTVAALKIDGFIRVAFSGLAAYPFRDAHVESLLNDSALDFSARADRIVQSLADKILHDIIASAEYRKFILKNTIVNLLETMREQSPCTT